MSMTTPTPQLELAERLSREIRAELARRDMTAGDLAELLGTSPAAVSRRLTGNVDWTLSELLSVADSLNVSLVDLLDRARAAA